jgi:peptide/nickel transport system substrate-binding protein
MRRGASIEELALRDLFVGGRISRRELVQRGAAIGVSGSMLSALLASPRVAASPTQRLQEGKPGGSLKIGWGFFQTFDPHVTSALADYTFLAAVFDRLIELTPDGKLYPGLATEWAESADGLTWTIKLRQGVKFHDGTPFNAEAVKANFERIVDPATKSQYAVFIIGPLDHVEVVDDLTVAIKMKQRYGRLPSALAVPALGMVSPAAAKQYGQDFGQHPVGSGPFMFKEWIEKDHVTIVRNPDYNWAPELHHHQGPAYLDEVTYQIIPEAGTLTAALLSGQVDAAGGVTPADWQGMEGNGDFTTSKALVQGYPPAGYFVNVKKTPTDDIKVRQAIEYALDFEGINAAVFDGTAESAHGIMSTFSWAYDPDAALYTYDPDRANSLLDEAGWVKDGDVRKKAGQTLELVQISFTPLRNLEEAVQAQLQEVGFKTQITTEEYPPYQQDTQGGKHNIAWTQWSGVDPADLHKIFHSDNIGVGWNLSHYSNPDVDQGLIAGDAESDPAKRKEIYAKVQAQVMADAAYVPLYNYSLLWAAKQGLAGMDVFDAVGSSPLLYDIYWDK